MYKIIGKGTHYKIGDLVPDEIGMTWDKMYIHPPAVKVREEKPVIEQPKAPEPVKEPAKVPEPVVEDAPPKVPKKAPARKKKSFF